MIQALIIYTKIFIVLTYYSIYILRLILSITITLIFFQRIKIANKKLHAILIVILLLTNQAPTIINWIYIIFTLLIYLWKHKPFSKQSIIILITSTLLWLTNYIATIYSDLYIPQNKIHLISKFTKFVLLVLLLICSLIFLPSYIILSSITIILITLFISSTAIIINILTLIFSSEYINQSHLPHFSSISKFILYKNNSSTLSFIVEENFFHDILDIDEPYTVIPIFFKSSSPLTKDLSTNNDIIWNSIRWESAIRKHAGSANLYWAHINKKSVALAPDSSLVVHIPIIPVYDKDTYLQLKENFPTIDLAKLPPQWDPYKIVTKFYNWPSHSIFPERYNEIEEEDW